MTVQVKSVILVTSGILIGASTTYLLTKSHFEEKYKAFADEEIASVKEAFGMAADHAAHMEQYVTRDLDDETIIEPKSEQKYTHIKRKTVADLVAEDIAATESPDMAEFEISAAGGDGEKEEVMVDLDLTQEERSPDFPYVIAAEEFFTEGETHEKICLAFYEGDQTLADDSQEKIDDVEEKIGTANLLRFGHGSQDPNVVYIRNEKLEVDFEVCREDGAYSVLVLGIADWENHVIPVDKAYALHNKNARNRE